MSLFNENIDVRATTGGNPALFSWRGHLYRVRRVIGSWQGSGDATHTAPAEVEVRLVRVAAESEEGQSNIADLTFDSTTDRWTMRRLWG